MIRHLCSGCDTVLWSSPRLAGLPIRCEICRRDNEVPRESSGELPLHLRHRRARPQSRPSLVPLVVGVVFVSAVLSGAVGFVVYSLWRGPSAEDSLPLTVTAKDGRSQFQVPGDWTDLLEDAEASVQAKVGSPDGNYVVEVRTEPKVAGEELTLTHCAAQAADRLARGTDGFLSWPQRMTLGGRPAIRYEVRCRVEGHPTAILLTVVEGSDHFHQVVGMLIGDADGDRELLERVVSTFREAR